jgi:hypothetical protein
MVFPAGLARDDPPFRAQQKRRVNCTRPGCFVSCSCRSVTGSNSIEFYEKTNEKALLDQYPTALWFGHLVPHVSSFSTCKFGVHQNCVKIKQPLPSGQLAFTLVVHRSTVLGHI